MSQNKIKNRVFNYLNKRFTVVNGICYYINDNYQPINLGYTIYEVILKIYGLGYSETKEIICEWGDKYGGFDKLVYLTFEFYIQNRYIKPQNRNYGK